MKYLCMVHLDTALQRSNLTYDVELAARRQLIAGHGLEAPERSLIVKVRNGETSMTDGPFSEAREQMGGFILVEARDMNDAAGIAVDIPLAKYGQIGIRPACSPMQA